MSQLHGQFETGWRVAEKFTTIHYDSDAGGDACLHWPAGLSKSFGKYRLAK